jgi:hypothetical protein
MEDHAFRFHFVHRLRCTVHHRVQEKVVFFFRGEGEVPHDIDAKTLKIRELLQLQTDDRRYVLVSSPARGKKGELTAATRSVLQVMMALASYVDVPPEHVNN